MSANRRPGEYDYFSEDEYYDRAEQQDFPDDSFDQGEFEREFGVLNGGETAGGPAEASGWSDRRDSYADRSDYESTDGGYSDGYRSGYADDYNDGYSDGYSDRPAADYYDNRPAYSGSDYYDDSSYADGYYDEPAHARRQPQTDPHYDDYSWGGAEEEYGQAPRRKSFFDWLGTMPKGKRTALSALVISLFLLVNIAAAGLSYFDRLMDGFDYDHDDEEPYVVSFTAVPLPDEGEPIQDGVSYTDVDDQQLMSAINEVTVGEDNLFHQDGTTNILLLGTDNRVKDGFARSDAIILLSVNRNTKKMVMTSFLRDTAVLFEGAEYSDKLTHGYGYGKGPLMVKTIQSHFGVKIDYYMAIDFFAFIDVVDYLGGVELEITEDERKVMNNYVKEINELEGLLPDNGFLWKTGKVTVTGKQALGYARNRYSKSGVGSGDFGRSARQRIVLQAIIDKLKSDPTKALGLLEEIAPKVKTDYTKEALKAEVLNVLDYISYEMVTTRVPANDTWEYGMRKGMSMIICDFKANQEIMVKNIYGVEMDDYMPEQ